MLAQAGSRHFDPSSLPIMPLGRCARLHAARGFGMIEADDDGVDLLFRYDTDMPLVSEGDRVRFKITLGKTGYYDRAYDVHKVRRRRRREPEAAQPGPPTKQHTCCHSNTDRSAGAAQPGPPTMPVLHSPGHRRCSMHVAILAILAQATSTAVSAGSETSSSTPGERIASGTHEL